MSNEPYNIVFHGKIHADFKLQQVKDNLGRIFKIDTDKIEKMFSGKPIAIKKSVDRETALKYLQAMKKAGAIVSAYSQAGAPVNLALSQETPPSDQHKNLSPPLSIAAPGERILPPQPVVEAQFNIEGISMAPVGVDVTDPEPPPPPFQADLSKLSMAEAGTRVLDPGTPPCKTRGMTFNAK